jgi:ATP-dependent Lhr-like helicase
VSVFARFAPRLQEAIVARLNWTSLRPVQEKAGDALLAGHNAVILAPTAGGKTEASLFPVISQMAIDAPTGVGAIYIAPIKALLNNQADRLGLYTEMVGQRSFVWHGDTDEASRRGFLKEPSELLMTTPESLEVMLISRRVDKHSLFSDLRFVVIDEVHALAGTDRGAHLMSVIERIARLSKHDLQRIGLSATVGNPGVILDWLKGASAREGSVVDPPKQPTRRQLLVIHRPDLNALCGTAAQMAKGQKSLFFCQSRAATEAVAESMRRRGTQVFVHHSAVSREERELAEERFRTGTDACVVCTSTLELGIDVGDLDRVLQAEAPDTVGAFLQRMGRTGRRENQIANTTFLCESHEGVLQAIALIELAKTGWVESITIDHRCWPVLIHQLLAMSLASNGIDADGAWLQLSQSPDFQGVERAEFDRLLAWLLQTNAMCLASGRLVLGPLAERRFGRKNFMELYAVFASPQSYTVETEGGRSLGSLTQEFVDRLVEGVSTFLLSGRGWAVLRIQHNERRVTVGPAPRGKQPTWGGFLPQFLGTEICQQIRRILVTDTVFPYLDASAAAVLEEKRAQMQCVLDTQQDCIEQTADDYLWWTFAGGRINATLRYALDLVGQDWVVTADNYRIKFSGSTVSTNRVKSVINELRNPSIWEDDKIWSQVAASLPSYRLSKFQSLMPPWIERETLAKHLLDIDGARRWLSSVSPSTTP